jgi:predicted secreted protein
MKKKKMRSERTIGEAQDKAEIDRLRAELSAEQRRTQEQIRDKHRILGEYEEQTQRLRAELGAANKEIARLKEPCNCLQNDSDSVADHGGACPVHGKTRRP